MSGIKRKLFIGNARRESWPDSSDSDEMNKIFGPGRTASSSLRGIESNQSSGSDSDLTVEIPQFEPTGSQMKRRASTLRYFIHRTVSEFKIKSAPKKSVNYVMFVVVKQSTESKTIDIRVEFTEDGQLIIEGNVPFEYVPTNCSIRVSGAAPLLRSNKPLNGQRNFTFKFKWDKKRDEEITDYTLDIHLSPTIEIDTIIGNKSSETMKNMMESSILTDFVIKTEGKDFTCHKVVLATNSVYFLRMFQSNLKEAKDNVLNWTNVYESTTVEALLYFIYLLKKPPNFNTVYPALFDLAHLCMLDNLVKMCASATEQMICVNNAADVLNKSVIFGLEGLQRSALNYISKTYDRVKKTVAWKKLDDAKKVTILDVTFSTLKNNVAHF